MARKSKQGFGSFFIGASTITIVGLILYNGILYVLRQTNQIESFTPHHPPVHQSVQPLQPNSDLGSGGQMAEFDPITHTPATKPASFENRDENEANERNEAFFEGDMTLVDRKKDRETNQSPPPEGYSKSIIM